MTAEMTETEETAADARGPKYVIHEREDDAFVIMATAHPLPRCLARRPKLLSNEEWRPVAQAIVDALEACDPENDGQHGWFYEDAMGQRSYSSDHPLDGDTPIVASDIAAATPEMLAAEVLALRHELEQTRHERDTVMHVNGLDWSAQKKLGYLEGFARCVGEADALEELTTARGKVEAAWQGLVDNLIRRSELMSAVADSLSDDGNLQVAEAYATLIIGARDNTAAANCICRLARAAEAGTTALSRSMTAIEDWLNIYASDLCATDRVEEARRRVGEHGTLAYIADVQQVNRDALGAMEALTLPAKPTEAQ